MLPEIASRCVLTCYEKTSHELNRILIIIVISFYNVGIVTFRCRWFLYSEENLSAGLVNKEPYYKSSSAELCHICVANLVFFLESRDREFTEPTRQKRLAPAWLMAYLLTYLLKNFAK